jgi:hypothetical protein
MKTQARPSAAPHGALALGIALFSAACSGTASGEAEGLASASQPMCGENRLAEVAEIACASARPTCESRVACCQAAGYAGTLDECVARFEHDCRRTALANLQSGACFLPDRHNPECERVNAELVAQCSVFALRSIESQRTLQAMGCAADWTHGNKLQREPCSGPQQCAEPTAEFGAYCIGRSVLGGAFCEIYPLSQAGAPCISGLSCGEGLTCGGIGLCVEPGAAGSACRAPSDCDSGACVGDACVNPVGLACTEDAPCGLHASCVDGTCRARSLENSSFCNFGPPKQGLGECRVESVVAEHLGSGARNCSQGFGSATNAAACLAEASGAGVDAFWLFNEPSTDRAYEAVIVRADGSKVRFGYLGSGDFRMQMTVCAPTVAAEDPRGCEPAGDPALVCEGSDLL